MIFGKVKRECDQRSPVQLKPAVFLHIQKTAGTTIAMLARQYYGNENVTSHGDFVAEQRGKSVDDTLLDRRALGDRYANVGFVSGHFGYAFAEDLIRTRYAFTFLRDPIERVLSFYSFCRSRDPNEFEMYALCQRYSLDDFLKLGLEDPKIMARVRNNQVWQLAVGYGNPDGFRINDYSEAAILQLAIEHLSEFDHIGFAETFEQDRDKVFEDLGMPKPTGRVVHNASSERLKASELSASTMKLLRQLTWADQELYETAWTARAQSTMAPRSLLQRLFSKDQSKKFT